MRIVIATTHLGIVGGAETHLRALLPLLQARGHDLGVVYGLPAMPGSASILDGMSDHSAWCADGKSPRDVVREVGSWRPDVVYNHTVLSPRLESAIAEAFPAILFAHGYHGTCVSGTKCFSRLGMMGCQRTFGAMCLVHYLHRGCGGGNPFTMLRLYRHVAQRRRNLDRYRAVVVGSRHMAEEFARHGVGSDRLVIAPLFPPDRIRDPSPPPDRPRSDRVLYVGRIAKNKGWRHLLKALTLAAADLGRRLTLVVAGDGPDREEMVAESRRTGIMAEFLGWVSTARVQAEMRVADLLVVPSLWPEPFGMVGIEAGCVGLPAAGYALGGIPDWLVPGVSGESDPQPIPDPAGLAAAILRALRSDAHLARLRRGAWETADAFTAERHLDIVEATLRSAAERWPASSSSAAKI
jgi:glycosyltransferase involved in cell wall biosynthesis